MRYKTDHRETVTYFKTIAEATELPIMIYNNPVDYKTEVTLDMFEELEVCDNIQAIKESTRDVTNVTRLRNRFGDRFKILCGVDTLAMEELCLGADGWVASHESNLPLARFMEERGRTMGQLRMFADYLEDGSWVDATIDTAQPERQPIPKVDMRKMLIPMGPVIFLWRFPRRVVIQLRLWYLGLFLWL
jgi:Dihydrodipicolinate synthetase family